MKRVTYLGKGMEAEWDGKELTINKQDGDQTILDFRQFCQCQNLIAEAIIAPFLEDDDEQSGSESDL